LHIKNPRSALAATTHLFNHQFTPTNPKPHPNQPQPYPNPTPTNPTPPPQDPYFNEPSNEVMRGKTEGTASSTHYNAEVGGWGWVGGWGMAGWQGAWVAG